VYSLAYFKVPLPVTPALIRCHESYYFTTNLWQPSMRLALTLPHASSIRSSHWPTRFWSGLPVPRTMS